MRKKRKEDWLSLEYSHLITSNFTPCYFLDKTSLYFLRKNLLSIFASTRTSPPLPNKSIYNDCCERRTSLGTWWGNPQLWCLWVSSIDSVRFVLSREGRRDIKWNICWPLFAWNKQYNQMKLSHLKNYITLHSIWHKQIYCKGNLLQ